MGVANIDRKGAIGATRHIGWILLRLSFSLGVLNLFWAFPKSVFGPEPAATTTVLVYNHAGVSRSILAAAEREAGRILDAAGVGIIWVECPMRSITASPEGPCLRTLKSTDIMLRVLPPLAHHSLKADVFGFAISPILASVYYEYAARLAVEEEYVEFGARTILGCVIAHELGHLLLGSNSHSSAGIMQSPWGQKEVREALNGTLLFTAEQAKRMRAEARTRQLIPPGEERSADRIASRDPRLSIEKRYNTHEGYVKEVDKVVQKLVRERLLLWEDAERYSQAAEVSNVLR